MPLEYAGDAVMGTPLIGDILKKAADGIINICNDAAQWTVRPEAILEDFRKNGHQVTTLSDIPGIDLEEVDKVVGWLAAKYKASLCAEGFGSGALGAPGLIIDVPALLIGNLRAIGEYATYYGFDINKQEERYFSLNILSQASSIGDASKGAAMAHLTKLSTELGKRAAWTELDKNAFAQLIKQMAKAMSIKLTKAKLAQLVPVIGGITGGGFNAYYTSKVCDSAYHLYRERFLKNKQALAGEPKMGHEQSGE